MAELTLLENQFEGGSHESQISDNPDALVAQNEHHLLICNEAACRVQLATKSNDPRGYRTLFYGLKKNHPHNVAIVHPLLFLIRRIIYSIVIVYMPLE